MQFEAMRLQKLSTSSMLQRPHMHAKVMAACIPQMRSASAKDESAEQECLTWQETDRSQQILRYAHLL